MACLRLVTFLPDLPLRNVPRFRSRITFATFRDADLLYFLLLAMTRLHCCHDRMWQSPHRPSSNAPVIVSVASLHRARA